MKELNCIIDSQIKLGNASDFSKNHASTQIVGNNVTKIISNESSQAALFCDCYFEDSDQIWESVSRNSCEDLSLFPPDLFNDEEQRCLF